MSTRNNIILYTGVLIVSLVFLIFRYIILENPNDFIKDFASTFAWGGITFSIGGFWQLFSTYGWEAIKCKILYPNSKVYVSLSYLLQIKLDGEEKYLLVKGSKVNQYQPVGGVYRVFNDKNIKTDWEAEIKADRDNPKDLRFFTKAKYIPDIIKWFKSGKNREFGVWREFQEELIETRILNGEKFKHIDVDYLRTEDKMMEKENRFNDEKYHTILYDIFKVNLSSEQEQEIRNLYNESKFTNKYGFVTADEIRKECFNDSHTKIGKHGKRILDYK
ncbi:SMODS-associated NUDIX domain-containing protein [Chryseobacterium oryctis]|uniref:CD-NTase-associated protein 16 NUDIX domain-containing protein n=1 Tax=Chryseobacterium oryctis TaxID=2952618 RepID=A0ABT3HS90_9FLAO|nr:hypothetical protein [Chryseobacterium oryctis]MCW3162645.1 hypothetical protein [Chryseobacterium oryctis]